MNLRIRTSIGYVIAIGLGFSLCWGERAEAGQWCVTMKCPACGANGFSSSGRECFSSQASCDSRLAAVKSTGPSGATYSKCLEEGAGTSSGSGGDLVTLSTKNIVQGIVSNNTQQWGMGMAGIGAAMILQGLQGDPAADARRAQEAALAAEQARRAEEQRRAEMLRQRAEVLRQQELAKQRILGLLKDSEPSTSLALKTGDSDTSLTVAETRGAFGSSVVVPTGIGSTPVVQGLQLKLGDDADRGSMQARQGFDTAGQIVGSNLPPPPPTPTSSQSKADVLKALHVKLDQGAKDKKFLDDLLATLKAAPNPDQAAISEVQSKIETNTQAMNQLTQQIKTTEQVTVEVDVSDSSSTK